MTRWRPWSSGGILCLGSIPELRLPGASDGVAPPSVAESSVVGDERRRARQHMAVVLAAGLLVRLYLIHRYPVVFGGDTILRLANPGHIVLSYQLPLLQAAIHYLSAISTDPLLVRYLMAVVGAAAGAGFYLLMSNLAPPSVALDASLLFVANPFLLTYSVVPYQEILMVAGLLFAFHFAFTGRWMLASVCLGAACLTRYEAWLACPVIGAAYLRQTGLRARTVVTAGMLFGWAPLGWIVFNRGLTPPGSFAVEASLNPERFVRWAWLGWVAFRNSPFPAVLLSALGAWVFVRRRLIRHWAYGTLATFLALFLIAILFSAHGTGERPERFVIAREAHIPVVGITVLAGLGLAALPRFRHAITALSIGTGLWMADRSVYRAAAEPYTALSYRVARYLHDHLAPGEHALVLARGIDASGYLAHLEEARGPAAVHDGLRILRTLETSPPDYQRILVHSGLGKDRLRSYATLSLGRFADRDPARTSVGPAPPYGHPQWIVQWSDFAPTNDAEADLAAAVRTRTPRQVFQQDTVWVRLYWLREVGP